jgi:tRNA threonylcarbamoyladenosine biosynthesis protein TsaB
MILVIDTSQPKIALCLFWPEKMKNIYISKSDQKSDNLLLKIKQILSRNNLNLKNLKTIVVNQGPGSFTGLRIGISIANTLAYSLNIPVICIKNQQNILKIAEAGFKKYKTGNKFQKIVLPFYGEEIG